ncbi:MAG: chlorophyll synthesis pathway protein BchC [Gammaproteobacteria bacterium]
MNTLAVVIEGPERLTLDRLALQSAAEDDIVVSTEWSGISTGTERLLWSGKMPTFPGMGYPLVPGYESVGRIEAIGRNVHDRRVGERVFVPGARCYRDVRGLFGGAASRLIVPAKRATPIDESLGENAVLLALAATARHAMAAPFAEAPELIVGHGVLGRLLARITIASGTPAPTVWELDAARASGAEGYRVCTPDEDTRRNYRSVYDVSGDARILDSVIARLAPGGEVTLAGFYTERMSFDFTAAFMREARVRVAAEWKDADLTAVLQWIAAGRLSLEGLITHRREASAADQAYRQAFVDPLCLKMILDWRQAA